MDPRTSWVGYLLVAGAALTVFLTLIEPSASRGLSPAMRGLFWAAHVAGPLLLAQGAQVMLGRWRASRRMGPWGQVVMAGLLASFLFVPMAFALDTIFPVAVDLDDRTTPPIPAALEEWSALVAPITVVWVALNATRLLRLGPVARSAGEAKDQAEPGFLGALSRDVRGPLVALSAELHYLRVHTTRGEALILYGFGRALEELGPAPGLRIHRSHWIDPTHVTGLQRSGGSLRVELSTGLSLPVSRNRRAEVLGTLKTTPP